MTTAAISFTARIQALLEADKDRILAKSAEEMQRMRNGDESRADDNDVASNESERHFAMRMADRDRQLLVKIDRTLAKIRDGSYGTCEACEEPIDEARLLARPTTDMCVPCKEQEERRERSYST